MAPPPTAVLAEAGRDAALLVVGHRGRGTARSVLLGSTGIGCVLHSLCPVSVVPDPADRSARHAGPEVLATATR